MDYRKIAERIASAGRLWTLTLRDFSSGDIAVDGPGFSKEVRGDDAATAVVLPLLQGGDHVRLVRAYPPHGEAEMSAEEFRREAESGAGLWGFPGSASPNEDEDDEEVDL